MRSFILLTFLFLGLGFYELSGGSDFVPETRASASVAEVDTTPLPAPEIVTRAEDDTIASVNALPGVPERLAQPLVTASAEVEAAEQAVADAIAAALAEPAPAATTPEPVLASLATPSTQSVDQRFVDATSLNVRSGPSTNDRVLTKLDQNAPVIVLSELTDGWALVRIGSDGTEGWVAARFLTQ
ncbi:SH3 domain-containing protein [Flavimaricola marinus]|uniref:Bacterial SH3 domain protein n=1 Tax=Flavimaricola marinus TaxID=1819565 RepID=A0A238LAK3_9RHOB|nr:SH3 domain-containing protein [Flavimaricola marinus]SMY06455.1 Bacterial SH3 domain protein [Flavimaricola marinus]